LTIEFVKKIKIFSSNPFYNLACIYLLELLHSKKKNKKVVKIEVLELKPIKNKRGIIFIFTKENDSISKREAKTLKKVLEVNKFDIITMNSRENLSDNLKETSIVNFFQKIGVKITILDIPEFAKGYLMNDIEEKKELVKELIGEYKSLEDKESFKAQNLESWIALLKREMEEKENILELKVKPRWVVKQIRDLIKTNDKDVISVLHFCSKEQIPELKKLFREIKVMAIIQKIEPEEQTEHWNIGREDITISQNL